jgi:hypothetical protein
MHTRPPRRQQPRHSSLAPLIGVGVLLAALCGCHPRTADEPVRSRPPEPESPSILDRTTIVPGQPEQQAPTAPPPPASPKQPGLPDATPDAPPADEGLRLTSPRAEDIEEILQGIFDKDRDQRSTTGELREIFPLVRADIQNRIVEFDGIVPIDAHDPRTPRVYLEVTVCAPDTKEHESLVMTRALASHIHAALLAIDLAPGKPGGFMWENEMMSPVPPTGDPVTITFIYDDADGTRREVAPARWIINAETRQPFSAGEAGGFVFAGSVMRVRQGREVYDADGVGTIVGLTTFGAETIAWREVISPDSQVHTPEWIADPAHTPPMGTEVTVRITPAKAAGSAPAEPRPPAEPE